MPETWWQRMLSGENRIVRLQRDTLRLQRDTLERLRIDRTQQTAIRDAVEAIHLQSGSMLRLLQQIGSTMATQADVDALATRVDAATTAVTTGVAAIREDIATLKASNPGVDTTALEASVGKLESEVADVNELDSENPAPPAG